MNDQKQALLTLLDGFYKEKISIGHLQYRLEQLIKEGMRRTFSPKQQKEFDDFFAWYADMYDPKLQPYAGWLGGLKDWWDQVIHGNYRIPLSAVKERAQTLYDFLQREAKDGRF